MKRCKIFALFALLCIGTAGLSGCVVEHHRDGGLTFWIVRKYNMAETEYVIKFLGAQFLGRDPVKYGIAMPDRRPMTASNYNQCS